MKAISAKEAKRINEKNGMCHPWGDGRTWYATPDDESEVYDFSSKRERDDFVKRCNAGK